MERQDNPGWFYDPWEEEVRALADDIGLAIERWAWRVLAAVLVVLLILGPLTLSGCTAVRAGGALTVEAARAYCARVPEAAKIVVRAGVTGGQKVIDCQALEKGAADGR